MVRIWQGGGDWVSGAAKVPGVSQSTQVLRKGGTRRVRGKEAYRAAPLTLLTSTPRTGSCCPLSLCRLEGCGRSQAPLAMVKVRGSVGRHFRVGIPLSEPVCKGQLQRCCGAGEGGVPLRAFSSFPSCTMWGPNPKP